MITASRGLEDASSIRPFVLWTTGRLNDKATRWGGVVRTNSHGLMGVGGPIDPAVCALDEEWIVVGVGVSVADGSQRHGGWPDETDEKRYLWIVFSRSSSARTYINHGCIWQRMIIII